MNQKLSNQQKGSLLAFIAVFLITPDSLLIRLSNIETWGMLFYRGAIPFWRLPSFWREIFCRLPFWRLPSWMLFFLLLPQSMKTFREYIILFFS